MKQLQLTAIFFLCGFFAVNAQSSNGNAIPEGFSTGSVTTVDNLTIDGYVKNNMKRNGEIILLSADGKKTKYTASQVSGVTVNNDHYTVISNAFYRVIADGTKIKLLRKASNASAIQYNGSEPILANAGEGAYDDYFIQTVSTKKMQMVRKKDFQKIFASTCSDCVTLAEDLKTNKIKFEEIEQAVALYNNCEK